MSEIDINTSAIEASALALVADTNFITLLGELQALRDDFEKKAVIGLDPTADPLLVQRNIGYLAGLDCLLTTPALIASGSLRKTRKPQRYGGRSTSTPPEE